MNNLALYSHCSIPPMKLGTYPLKNNHSRSALCISDVLVNKTQTFFPWESAQVSWKSTILGQIPYMSQFWQDIFNKHIRTLHIIWKWLLTLNLCLMFLHKHTTHRLIWSQLIYGIFIVLNSSRKGIQPKLWTLGTLRSTVLPVYWVKKRTCWLKMGTLYQ